MYASSNRYPARPLSLLVGIAALGAMACGPTSPLTGTPSQNPAIAASTSPSPRAPVIQSSWTLVNFGAVW